MNISSICSILNNEKKNNQTFFDIHIKTFRNVEINLISAIWLLYVND